MDLSVILSITAILVSFIGTVFNILYSKKHLAIVEKELAIIQARDKEKAKFDAAAEAVQDLMQTIDEHGNSRWYSFPDIRSLSDSVLRFLHDKKAKKLDLAILPLNLRLSIMNEGIPEEATLTPSDNFERFLDFFKKDFQGATFFFESSPEVIGTKRIELSDSLMSIKEIYSALDNACQYSSQIKNFDMNILTEIEDILQESLRKLYEELMKEDHITILTENRYDEISNMLLNKIVAYKTIIENLDSIKGPQGPLYNRLGKVHRELFQSARISH